MVTRVVKSVTLFYFPRFFHNATSSLLISFHCSSVEQRLVFKAHFPFVSWHNVLYMVFQLRTDMCTLHSKSMCVLRGEGWNQPSPDCLGQGSSTRGPPAALRRVLCGPGRVSLTIYNALSILKLEPLDTARLQDKKFTARSKILNNYPKLQLLLNLVTSQSTTDCFLILPMHGQLGR